MNLKSELKKVLKELRKNSKKRNFEQSVDLIINLQKFNPKKESVKLFIDLPHKIKDKKICGFFEKNIEGIDVITKKEFDKYKDKKKLKNLVKKYGFFIAEAKLMPAVATSFGRVLGPAGKMPSPQLGILPAVNEDTVKQIKQKINKTVRVKTKEPSIKLIIGKESMDDEQITENIMKIYTNVLNSLTRKKENIKNIKIKFTMSKPIKIKP